MNSRIFFFFLCKNITTIFFKKSPLKIPLWIIFSFLIINNRHSNPHPFLSVCKLFFQKKVRDFFVDKNKIKWWFNHDVTFLFFFFSVGIYTLVSCKSSKDTLNPPCPFPPDLMISNFSSHQPKKKKKKPGEIGSHSIHACLYIYIKYKVKTWLFYGFKNSYSLLS